MRHEGAKREQAFADRQEAELQDQKNRFEKRKSVGTCEDLDGDFKKMKKKKNKPDLFSPIEPGQKKPKENTDSAKKNNNFLPRGAGRSDDERSSSKEMKTNKLVDPVEDPNGANARTPVKQNEKKKTFGQ